MLQSGSNKVTIIVQNIRKQYENDIKKYRNDENVNVIKTLKQYHTH